MLRIALLPIIVVTLLIGCKSEEGRPLKLGKELHPLDAEGMSFVAFRNHIGKRIKHKYKFAGLKCHEAGKGRAICKVDQLAIKVASLFQLDYKMKNGKIVRLFSPAIDNKDSKTIYKAGDTVIFKGEFQFTYAPGKSTEIKNMKLSLLKDERV